MVADFEDGNDDDSSDDDEDKDTNESLSYLLFFNPTTLEQLVDMVLNLGGEFFFFQNVVEYRV